MNIFIMRVPCMFTFTWANVYQVPRGTFHAAGYSEYIYFWRLKRAEVHPLLFYEQSELLFAFRIE